jgi:hypothetical protein
MAVVFGFHYHYRGGASRDEVTFGSASDLISYLTAGRPGDHFTLFCLESVASLARMHLGVASIDDAIPFTDSVRADLARIASESLWDEVTLVNRLTNRAGRVRRCSILGREPANLTAGWGEYGDYVSGATWPRGGELVPLRAWSGEVFAFDEADLERDRETGAPIEGLIARGALRSWALIEAKRPNDEGLVPMTGAY